MKWILFTLFMVIYISTINQIESRGILPSKPINSRSRHLANQRKRFGAHHRHTKANSINKENVEALTAIFKRNVDRLKGHDKLDLIFLIDESNTVGLEDFKDEIKFVERFVSGMAVDANNTRVAVVTFAHKAILWVDQISSVDYAHHKCSLLAVDLPAITFSGGGTYTLGAFEKAQILIANGREEAKKVILLITDGESNGGDPRQMARNLKRRGAEIFTFGIAEGNVRELTDIASEPKDDHRYILEGFDEFEAIVRRALHSDSELGNFIVEDSVHCDKYCTGGNCCNREVADCRCGTTTGKYTCVCDVGMYGSGIGNSTCYLCPEGTYKSEPTPGDINTCTPCPDEHMFSPEGSINVNACECVIGFNKVGTTCEPVKCRTILPPPYGNILKCDTGYLGVCEFGCERGYDISGSSLLTCGAGNLWEDNVNGGEITPPHCIIRKCEPLSAAVPHASLQCTSDQYEYMTSCTYECELGYQLYGSETRVCEADRSWTGVEPYCKEITCDPVPPPVHGIMTGDCLQNDTLKYGAQCFFECPHEGFELSISDQALCSDEGHWVPPVEHRTSRICTDLIKPTIACPENVIVSTDTQKPSAMVEWELPVANDNSGDVIVSPTWQLPAPFYIGKTSVTYTATDDYGLESECSFSVTVEDREPPVIVDCKSPQPFVVEVGVLQSEYISWREPSFLDNSGSFDMTTNISFGVFPKGTTKGSYVATDQYGNTKQCIVTIIVQDNRCPRLEVPKHGRVDCDVFSVGAKQNVECSLKCDTGWYGITMTEYTSLVCYEGETDWDLQLSTPIDCSRKKYSSELLKDFRVGYHLDKENLCHDEEFIRLVKEKFMEILVDKVPSWCTPVEVKCTLVDVSVTCIEVEKKEEEEDIEHGGYGGEEYYGGYAIGYGNYGDVEDEDYKRNKRTAGNYNGENWADQGDYGEDGDTGYDENNGDAGYEGVNYGGNYGAESVPVDSIDSNLALDPSVLNYLYGSPAPKKEIKILEEDVGATIPLSAISGMTEDADYMIDVVATIKGEVTLKGTLEDDHYLHTKMVEFIRVMDMSSEFMENFKIVEVQNDTESEELAFDEESYDSSKDELICPLGTILRQSAFCVNCPIGTFYDVTHVKCESCKKGFYQDLEAQFSCIACPEGTSTSHKHAREVSECKDLCKPGFFSDSGLEPCSACPKDTYVDFNGATKCNPCAEGTGTVVTAATDLHFCGVVCEPGHISSTGFVPCFPCRHNTYQFQKGQSFCYQCPEPTWTMDKGSTTFRSCQGISQVFNTADIEWEIDTLMDSDVLDLRVIKNLEYYNDCFLDLCENNSTCSGLQSGYTCACQPGYAGQNCDLDIDECLSTPCYRNSSCVDLLNGFRCNCEAGFTGHTCSVEINECEVEPCQNGATCIDGVNKFICDCRPGFTGIHCEINIDDCEPAPCENDAICIDRIEDYECECVSGFTGKRCEVNIDDCLSQPCLNGATCQDGIDLFVCNCLPGYEGLLCETDINECASNPCQNEATCMDLVNKFHCACMPGFYGVFCETEGDPNYDMKLLKPNIDQHAAVKYGLKNLTEVSVAFFMQSSATDVKGTPFSYSVGSGKLADTLALTDLSALTIYVNGEFEVTDLVKFNDGRWYHVVLTWKSDGGKWEVFINGVLAQEGKGLASETTIPGGGVLVIGQEQDCLGACFSPDQEFIGTISQFNIYDRVLQDKEIMLLQRNCANYLGSMRAWPDFLGGLENIEIIRPGSYCMPCSELEDITGTVYNHLIDRRKVIVKCEDGYEFKKLRNRGIEFNCGNQGKWRFRGSVKRGEDLHCHRVSCPALRDIYLGHKHGHETKFGDTVEYSCHEGYQVVGSAERTCQANKKWSGTQPSCGDVDECKQANNSCHENAVCKNTQGSYKCYCKHGYRGDGFVCEEINCGAAGSLPFGTISGDNFKLGGVVSYACNRGYDLEGPSNRICLENDTWSSSTPVCNKVICKELPPVENSTFTITNNDRSFETIITYKCVEGYFMTGEAKRECLFNGHWSNTAPICERVPCPSKPIVPNSVVIAKGELKFGDVLTYYCENDYRRLGSETLTCNASGEWEAADGSFPLCEREPCEKPESLLNGKFVISTIGDTTISDDVYTYNTVIQYSCNEGYNLNGNAHISCISGRQWDVSSPKCDIVICGEPEGIPHGQLERDGVIYQSVVKYICDPGYQMQTVSALACTADGIWKAKDSNDLPVCLPKACPRPAHVANSIYELIGADDFVYPVTVRYTCNTGYNLIGTESITCDSNAVWSPPQDVFCELVTCPEPSIIPHGTYENLSKRDESSVYSYRDKVLYKCDEGFHLIEGDVLFCEASGEWSSMTPFCIPVQCLPPEVSPNVESKLVNGPYAAGMFYESVIEYSCSTGYEFIDKEQDRSRECLYTGSWSGSTPSCQKKSCGSIVTVDHSSNNWMNIEDSAFYEDTINYECDQGFKIGQMNPTVTCLESGTFSTIPTCKALSCGQPPAVRYSDTMHVGKYGQNVFESTVTYTCQKDFRMIGERTITCGADGIWGPLPPVCQVITCDDLVTPPHSFTIVSAAQDDVLYPELYTDNKNQPRSAAITVCDAGYEVVEEVGFLRTTQPYRAESEILHSVNVNDLDTLDSKEKNRFNLVVDRQLNKAPANLVSDPLEINDPVQASFISECSEEGGWLTAAVECQLMKCSQIPTLKYGALMTEINKPFLYFGESVDFACDVGHYFEGQDVSTDEFKVECMWSDVKFDVEYSELPNCIPKPCEAPEQVLYGNYLSAKTEFVFNDELQLACSSGFELIGNEYVKCTEQQTWEPTAGSCVRIQCPDPSEIINGQVIGSNFRFESLLEFICNDGYYLDGAETAECMANRKWSNMFPVCKPFSCGNPPEVNHASLQTMSNVFKECAVYSCNDGYYLTGDAVSYCQSNSEWEDNSPECHKLQCPPPVLTPNSDFDNVVIQSNESYTFGDKIVFKCNAGYETADNDRIAICTTDGLVGESVTVGCTGLHLQVDKFTFANWTSNAPQCQKKDCGEPPTVDKNGFAKGEETTFENQWYYYCNEGYFHDKEFTVISCLETGKWSHEESPKCLPKDCGVPETPENGVHAAVAYTYNNHVNFSCDDGYELFGSGAVHCKADGTWTDDSPQCFPVDCGPLTRKANSILHIEATTLGSSALYTCEEGYYLSGENITECLSSGDWSNHNPPDCFRVECEGIDSIANGRIHGSGHKFMDILTFSCDEGYDLIGSISLECQSNAEWSSVTPHCKPRDCGPPSTIENGYFNPAEVGKTIFESIIQYHCNPGYEFADITFQIECQANAKWTRTPTCQRIVCDTPTAPTFGEIVDLKIEDYRFEDVIEFKCHQGYILSGSSEITCTADETWTGFPPTCVPVDCNPPADIDDGESNFTSTSFMSIVDYSCIDGFETSDETRLECLHTGMWSHDAPTCNRVSCGLPIKIKNMQQVNGTNDVKFFEDVVSYNCKEGYFLNGGKTAQCGADKKWIFDGDMKPECILVTCEDPVQIENGKYKEKLYSYYNFVVYSCNVGYYKFSEGTLMCDGNTEVSAQGFYSGEPAVCLPVSCGSAPTVENGMHLSSGTTFQHTTTYKCKKGYFMIGSDLATCQANSKWTKKPSCYPVACNYPTLPDHSNITVTSIVFPAVLDVVCKTGYFLKGSNKISCTAEATWENSPPSTCEPVPCGDPSALLNGKVSDNGKVFMSRAIFSCDPGYVIHNGDTGAPIDDLTVMCQSNGEWEDSTFVECRPRRCGRVESIDNGRIISNKKDAASPIFYYLDEFAYECDEGYYMVGESDVACTQTGEFSHDAPTCHPVSCGEGPNVKFSLQTNTGITFKHTMEYTCLKGYSLWFDGKERESLELTCTSSGEWNPQPKLSCDRVICEKIPVISHGKAIATQSQYQYTDTVSYKCNEGYEIKGTLTSITCLYDKTWSKLPVCGAVDCGGHACPDNAQCISGETTYQNTFIANCNEGYEFEDFVESITLKCQSNKRWSEPEQFSDSCRRISCGQTWVPISGKITSSDNLFESTIQYTCEAGYDLHGPDEKVCTSNRTWSPDEETFCTPKDCGLAQECPPNAECDYSGTTFKSIFTLKCEIGYELARDIDTQTSRCMEDGNWSDMQYYVCMKKECNPPPVIEHGNVLSFSEGLPVAFDTIQYYCDEGYYLSEDVMLECLPDRSYSVPPPICLPKDCLIPDTIPNGDVVYSGHTYQHTAKYSCDDGYYISGNKNWHCASSGNWETRQATRQRRAAESVWADKSFDSEEYISTEYVGSGETDRSFATKESDSLSLSQDFGNIWIVKSYAVEESTYEESASTEFVGSGETDRTFAVKESHSPHDEPNAGSLTLSEDFGSGEIDRSFAAKENPYLHDAASADFLVLSEDYGSGDSDRLFAYKETPVLQSSFMDPGFDSYEPLIPAEDLPICMPVSCGVATPVSHATASTGEDEVFFQGRVVYTCQHGYEMIGVSEATCQANGLFGPYSVPSCARVSCGELPVARNCVFTDTENTLFGDTSIYKPRIGYEFDNVEIGNAIEVTCSAGRSWLPTSLPQCSRVKCPQPKALNHGSFTQQDVYLYQDKISYDCDEGYDPLGQTIFTCQSDRTWSPQSLPKCKPRYCGEPSPIEFGNFEIIEDDRMEYTYGQEIEYTCNRGFYMHGDITTSLCMETSTWSETNATCLRVSCPDLPIVQDGWFEKNGDLVFETVVKYYCDEGFELEGQAALVCKYNGKWTSESPVCEPISCVHPPHVANSFFDVHSLSFGESITYECFEGFEMIGHHTLTCLANQKIDYPAPKCIPVQCPTPENSPFSKYEVTSGLNFVYTSTIEYSCIKGYKSKDSLPVISTCQSDRTWSEEAPYCEIVSCDEPEITDHSIVNYDQFVYQSIVSYMCEPGYELDGLNIEDERCMEDSMCRKCSHHGVWGDGKQFMDSPNCNPISCGEPPNVDNSEQNVDSYIFMSEVEYICNTGYVLMDDPDSLNIRLSCQADGTWGPDQNPSCVRIKCSEAKSITNGYFSIESPAEDDFVYQTKILYGCNEGYQLVGESKMSCDFTGNWSENVPECLPVPCGIPSTIQNADVEYTSVTYKATSEYTCLEGYETPTGANIQVSSCLSNKLWSPVAADCQRILCGDPVQPDNGKVVFKSVEYETIAIYSCNEGYQLTDVNHQSSVCQANKEWSNPVVTCERIYCEDAPDVENGFFKFEPTEALRFEDSLIYDCEIGYNMIGNSQVICLANGKLSKPPVCELIKCKLLPVMENAVRYGDDFTFDNVVEYQCDTGYEYDVDVTTIECQCGKNGKFIPVDHENNVFTNIEEPCHLSLPTCKRITCGTPPVVENGVLAKDQTSYRYEDVVEYYCIIGFAMDELTNLTCSADKTYKGKLPVCDVITCVDPPSVENAQLLPYSAINLGQRVDYECVEGYELTSPIFKICLQSRDWSSSDDRCKPVVCPSITSLANGFIVPQGHGVFGDTMSFVCAEGYELIGSSAITCTSSGAWSSATPICERVKCEMRNNIDNGKLVLSSTSSTPQYEDKLIIECDRGYFKEGKDFKCKANRKWSKGGRCDPEPCPYVPSVDHAFINSGLKNSYYFGDVIVFSCEDGYFMRNGDGKMTCEAEGRFETDEFGVQCDPVDCGPVPIIENGFADKETAVFPQNIQYSCDKGYYLSGIATTSCGPSGNYDGDIPHCLPISCGTPPPVDNTEEIDVEFTFGMTAQYTCIPGFEITSPSSGVECLENGEYSDTEITCSRVKCPDLTYLEWGHYSNLNRTFESEGMFTCEDGFHLTSNVEEVYYFCLANGEWSDDIYDITSCTPNKCYYESGVPNSIEESTKSPFRRGMEGPGPVYGDSLFYICHPGYYLEGASEMKCEKDGQWSSAKPKCVPVSCGTPPNVDNAIEITGNFTYTMVAEYWCSDGYELKSDNSAISCLETGYFEKKEIICDRVSCPRIANNPHGAIMTLDGFYEDTNRFLCDDGYESHSEIICQSNGQWSGKLLPCQPVSCEKPPVFEHATLKSKKGAYVYLDMAEYICDNGFHMESKSALMCLEVSEFEDDKIKCEIDKCTEIPFIKNGQIIHENGDDVTTFGETVTITCKTGYMLEGKESIHCLAGGVWSKITATCQAEPCGLAPRIDNASPSGNYIYEYGDIVSYTCNPGYRLSSSKNTIACNANRQFEESNVICEKVLCPELLPVDNADKTGIGTSFNDHVTYTCQAGFYIGEEKEKTTTIKCESDGTWSTPPSDIICEPEICKELPHLAHGTLDVSKAIIDKDDPGVLLFNSVVILTCDKGYTLMGTSRRHCLPDGSWSGEAPHCRKIDCGTLPIILHGKIIGKESTTFESEVTYLCNDGYELQPEDAGYRQCTESGSWTGQAPLCRAISCGEFTVENGKVLGAPASFKQFITITCDEGYSLSGDARMKCGSNGSYEGEEPLCIKEGCGVHPVVENAFLDPEEVESVVGMEIVIQCQYGYELEEPSDMQGIAVRVCLETGEWSGNFPTCVQIIVSSDSYYEAPGELLAAPSMDSQEGCLPPVIEDPRLKLVEGQELFGSEFYMDGDTLKYCCPPGFILVGPMAISCGFGEWSQVGKCVAKCEFECMNTGQCVSPNRCTCTHGWKGRRCHKPVCKLPCLNGGYCSAPFTCECKNGWTGSRCQKPVCEEGCKNNGQCIRPNVCRCPYGFSGPDCSQRDGWLYF